MNGWRGGNQHGQDRRGQSRDTLCRRRSLRASLCNILVCLAVWLAFAGRSIVDKICAIIFPISAFVAAGFEHSIANMYFIPLGILLKDHVQAGGAEQLSWTGLW